MVMVYKILRIIVAEFIKTQKRYPLQNSYPNFKTTCHIKLIFFLGSELIKKIFLAKYLIYAAAVLKKGVWGGNCGMQ